MNLGRAIRSFDFAFLFLLLATWGARAAATRATSGMSVDGGYYLGVAEQVQRGHGLVSNLSLYNFGYERFPGPTGIYPLWPLLLGYAGRLVDIQVAAHWLPWFFYGVAGIGAWLLGRELTPAGASGRPFLHLGHLFAALLWLSPHFAQWSATPHTEPLAWSCLTLGLWRFAQNRANVSLRWGLELGVWACLAYFARAQLMIFPMAVGLALLVHLPRHRDRAAFARFAAATLAPMVFAVGGWWAYVASFTAHHGLNILLRFDRCQVNDLLPPLVVMVPIDGLFATLWDRVLGLGVAWGPTDRSYWDTVYALHWAAPVAVVGVVVQLWRSRSTLRGSAAAWLARPEAPLYTTLVLFAVGGLVSVQMVHKQFGSPWYFDQREGLVALPAFILSVVWCLRQGGVPRWIAAALLLVSLGFGARFLWRAVSFDKASTRPDEDALLARWLERRDAAEPGPLVVALEEGHAQRTAWRSPDIGFHWLSTRTTYATVGTLVHPLGSQLVIWDSPRASWGFLRAGGHIEADYTEVSGVPRPFHAVAPRETPLAKASPRRVLLLGMEPRKRGAAGSKLQHAASFSLEHSASARAAAQWATVVSGRSSRGPAIWAVAAANGHPATVVSWPGAKGSAATTSDLTVAFLDRPAEQLLPLLEARQPGEVIVLAELGTGTGSGTLTFVGEDIPGGHRTRPARLEDVAPTVAWLLGVPVAEDLSGRVLSEALAWDAAGAIGRTDVPSWR